MAAIPASTPTLDGTTATGELASRSVRVAIDASNLRSGGGLNYLAGLLGHGDPLRHGIERVVVWASRSTLAHVPERPWLDRVHIAQLDLPLPARVAWQMFQRSTLALEACDVVFAPAATHPGTFRPYVAMSTNMLPFAPAENSRYRLSVAGSKFALLRSQQIHAFRSASAVIYLTDFARATIGPSIAPEAPHETVIPTGVGEIFRQAPRAVRALQSYSSDHPFRFVYTSDIRQYKHQWNVIDAVLLLRREGLPVALDLVGAINERPAANRFRESLAKVDGDTAAVRYLGARPHASLPDLYREADAFIFASTCENLPLTLVEAMASGLPIAASRTPPMPDILGAGGIYFDAEDRESIAAALRTLMNDPQLRETAARQNFDHSTIYSWAACADQTFALLAAVARRGQTNRQSA